MVERRFAAPDFAPVEAGALPQQAFGERDGERRGVAGDTQSFTATVTNASITTGLDTCRVTVGGGGANDGTIVCTVG
jgi:hypothetical protein